MYVFQVIQRKIFFNLHRHFYVMILHKKQLLSEQSLTTAMIDCSHSRGKSHPKIPRTAARQVHSYVCGKKRMSAFVCLLFSGTLPRVWEKGHEKHKKYQKNRYTPTCVGKSSGVIKRNNASLIYSHSRGKKGLIYYPLEERQGILPLAWEKTQYFRAKLASSGRFVMKIFTNYFA